ncbi:transmembrane amino acid transporter protein (macronuclear) [Tetrahymena thermophila SB210]|uniref:Transmembrane amino acid transporter protein n=1 Tax=Tetrahymena thermophila (strain SB210) TaxID=312017 RepID=Q22CG6_TETTS|nr:transmembrane amino acid transporter protein [Tetrahymena thermophila SB210]EAR82963.2 transmembrane amino acid transporter protein [Tetrahymena thermophila SB210]|eukprot:XP_001030626.2 transmembrane amino acid transporter protein [Tetrahymena thermophila SB210]
MADSLEFQHLRNNPKYVKEFAFYVKSDFIGRGRIANGGVYCYKYSNKEYAVKIYTEKKSESFTHILREISILDRINNVIKSDSIIRFHGFYFEILGNSIQFYIIMDKADGTLTEFIQQKYRFKMTELLEITNQFIITFAELEGNGIAHRDIKTDNILYIRNSENKIMIKITDFSEGKLVDNEQTHNTLVGNAEHLSPELYYMYRRGETDIKYNPFKNDVYGIGVLLCQLASCEYRPSRKEEAKVDPYKNDKGPCDDLWNLRLQQTKQYYLENSDNVSKSIIEQYFIIIKEMISYNPKQRPRFYQIMYQWMAIYSLKIISIEQENKYIQQITSLEEKIQKLELNNKKISINGANDYSMFRRQSEMSQFDQSDISAEDMKCNSNFNLDNLHAIKEITSPQESENESSQSSDSQSSISDNENSLKDVQGSNSIQKNQENYQMADQIDQDQTIKKIDLKSVNTHQIQNSQSSSYFSSEMSTPEYSGNRISAFNSPSFRYLFQDSDTNIQSLDGKKKEITIIKNRTDLKQINKNTQVIQLNELSDIIKNELIQSADQLKYLVFHLHSKKSNLQQISFILSSFGHTLIFLNLNIGSWQNMKDEDVKVLCEGIQKQQILQVIYLFLWEWGMENPEISDKSLEEIGNMFVNLKTLVKIKLGLDRWGLENKKITDSGLQYLLQSLEQLKGLQVLDLSLTSFSKKNPNITNKSLQNLGDFITKCSYIQKLSLTMKRWDNENQFINVKNLKTMLDQISQKAANLNTIFISLKQWNISEYIKQQFKSMIKPNFNLEL